MMTQHDVIEYEISNASYFTIFVLQGLFPKYYARLYQFKYKQYLEYKEYLKQQDDQKRAEVHKAQES